MRIFVFSPDYSHQSAGIEALHYLMYLLQRAGHKVSTNAAGFNPRLDLKPAHRLLPEKSDDMIIAPEVVFLDSVYRLGLPILRWALYYPGVHSGPFEYSEYEIVYHYQKSFENAAAKASFYGNSTEFFLPHLNKEEFESKEEDGQKNGDLYFVHKGVNMKTHPEAALEINRQNTATREQYLKLLREHKTLYCYDRDTFLAVEAHLSGMSVFLWNYDNNSWERAAMAYDKFRDYEKDTLAVSALINDFNKKRKKIAATVMFLAIKEKWAQIKKFFEKQES